MKIYIEKVGEIKNITLKDGTPGTVFPMVFYNKSFSRNGDEFFQRFKTEVFNERIPYSTVCQLQSENALCNAQVYFDVIEKNGEIYQKIFISELTKILNV